MNGLRNGGLISGQILVNPAVKSGVTQISGGYKSALQTTKALPLSAGLITMSSRARSDWRALNSMSVRLGGLLGPNMGSCSISCRHFEMNSSTDPYWSSEGDQEYFLALMVSKTSLSGTEDWLWKCAFRRSTWSENGFGICFKGLEQIWDLLAG
jgi:hypothetical protein